MIRAYLTMAHASMVMAAQISNGVRLQIPRKVKVLQINHLDNDFDTGPFYLITERHRP
jgi:hypothetical protein